MNNIFNKLPLKAKKIVGITCLTMGVLFLLFIFIPLVFRPAPAGIVADPASISDPDSRFAEVNGIKVHYKLSGSGETAVILLHGFGSNLDTWREVIGPLSDQYTVVCYDWVGFGLTGRPGAGSWGLVNPYSTVGQAELLSGLMGQLGFDHAVLVGNSAGALIAVQVAFAYPEKVSGLILVDPALKVGKVSPFLRWILETSQMDFYGPLFSRIIESSGKNFIQSAWYDPGQISDEIMAAYTRPLRIRDWDKALWEFTKAEKADGLAMVKQTDIPLLIITGQFDKIIPAEGTIELESSLADADLVVIDKAGHVPQEERPAEFIEAVGNFLVTLQD